MQSAIYQTTTQDIGYYAIPAVRICLNLCLVSLHLPSSSRFGNLLPTISYLGASQGRRAVKVPTVGAHRGADRRDHWESLKGLIIKNQSGQREASLRVKVLSRQIRLSAILSARLRWVRDELHATRSRPSRATITMKEPILFWFRIQLRIGIGLPSQVAHGNKGRPLQHFPCHNLALESMQASSREAKIE